MGREVRRVPSGFNWPLNQVWPGFLSPDWLSEATCVACEGRGWSPQANLLIDQWYGNAPFRPEDNGSTPWLATDEPIRRFAERNVRSAPEFYGPSEAAIEREARRLLGFWNAQWHHHLSQQDVDDLLEAGRLTEFTHHRVDGKRVPIEPLPHPTAHEVNSASFFGFNGTGDYSYLIRARAAREGFSETCDACDGHGSHEKFTGQREMQEAWQPIDPPAGEAWQLWETVSEGSPVTPAFDTPEGLARHLTSDTLGYADALQWVTGPGWAPSGVIDSTGLHTNIEGAVHLQDAAS